MTLSCIWPFGAVTAGVRPSWVSAVPMMLARMRSFLASATDCRRSTTAMQPSLRI